ncbi:MAG: hypothetical protein IJ428_01490 [Clostridia bacterium]|nr:hypothetical protein [Clostridia bacterium]
MVKRINLIAVFCLLLCLFTVGCSSKDKTPVNGDSIIYAPSDPIVDDKPHDTINESETVPTDTDTEESKTQSDTETDTETDTDTVPPLPHETDPSQGTDAVTENPDTPPTPFVPTVTEGMVKLGEALFPGEPLAGRIFSTESEKLRLVIDYECHMDISGSVTFDFDVGLECYDINCGARVDTGKLTVDGTTHTFSTGPISNNSGALTYVPFTSYTYTCDALETSCTVSASWSFNGVYGGIKIDTLTAGAVLDWGA